MRWKRVSLIPNTNRHQYVHKHRPTHRLSDCCKFWWHSEMTSEMTSTWFVPFVSFQHADELRVRTKPDALSARQKLVRQQKTFEQVSFVQIRADAQGNHMGYSISPVASAKIMISDSQFCPNLKQASLVPILWFSPMAWKAEPVVHTEILHTHVMDQMLNGVHHDENEKL